MKSPMIKRLNKMYHPVKQTSLDTLIINLFLIYAGTVTYFIIINFIFKLINNKSIFDYILLKL